MFHHVALLTLALSIATASCGDRSTCPDPPCDASECELICQSLRPSLIDNLGVPPESIDCSDAMWVGDCAHCTEVLRREFDVQPGPCGTLNR